MNVNTKNSQKNPVHAQIWYDIHAWHVQFTDQKKQFKNEQEIESLQNMSLINNLQY